MTVDIGCGPCGLEIWMAAVEPTAASPSQVTGVLEEKRSGLESPTVYFGGRIGSSLVEYIITERQQSLSRDIGLCTCVDVCLICGEIGWSISVASLG